MLICQRPQGKQLAGLWEFPGGKVETGETPDGAQNAGLFRTVGFVAALTGVAVGGLGAYFGVRAISKNAESVDSGNCAPNNVCNGVGKQTRLDAQSAGNVSTALFIAGGALVAGGLVIVLTSGTAPAAKPRAALAPALSYDGAGVMLQGRF